MERIPRHPKGSFVSYFGPDDPESETAAGQTKNLLTLYFNGAFESPQQFDEFIKGSRERFPDYDQPDPGVEWEENLLRQIGYKRTPEGLIKLDDWDLSPQAQRMDMLNTVNWPYG